MSDDNKEQFNFLTQKTLALLIDACPVPVKITPETFDLPNRGYEHNPQNSFAMGYRKTKPNENVLANLLKWLEDEKYIRENDGFYVATLKTLVLYDVVPSAINH